MGQHHIPAIVQAEPGMVVSGFRRIIGPKKHGKCFFGERFAGVADRQAGPAVSFLRGETHGDDSARFAGVGGIGNGVTVG